MVKPSEWLNAIMEGRIEIDEAPESVQSWLRLVTFKAASDLLGMTAEQKKAKAKEYPEGVRDRIREDYKWILKSRRL